MPFPPGGKGWPGWAARGAKIVEIPGLLAIFNRLAIR